MHSLISLFGSCSLPLFESLMIRNARKLARALFIEYAHEERFEVSFQETDLRTRIADILRQEYGCQVTEDEFKQGLSVQVPKSGHAA